ncbi:MAG: PH domain-containing protein [Pseudomonadota bacterium]
MDHYQLLGVSREATIEEIKKAVASHMRAIDSAYQTLTDEVRRREYDAMLDAEEGLPLPPLAEHYSTTLEENNEPIQAAVRGGLRDGTTIIGSPRGSLVATEKRLLFLTKLPEKEMEIHEFLYENVVEITTWDYAGRIEHIYLNRRQGEDLHLDVRFKMTLEEIEQNAENAQHFVDYVRQKLAEYD